MKNFRVGKKYHITFDLLYFFSKEQDQQLQEEFEIDLDEGAIYFPEYYKNMGIEGDFIITLGRDLICKGELNFYFMSYYDLQDEASITVEAKIRYKDLISFLEKDSKEKSEIIKKILEESDALKFEYMDASIADTGIFDNLSDYLVDLVRVKDTETEEILFEFNSRTGLESFLKDNTELLNRLKKELLRKKKRSI